ncbi:hypothetical protein AK812_SmicGene43089 [Symbiodinium microadriaticum]|uniref:Uncharacterized protein n=1 Tax=Symbiodinium microadriaticum TaxID=2951 RepID=A0A1Q9C1X5_SYMMI|nr:hypothetical protein AK812_SmicGene43089 [Symbiodinium microadriaticum]
MTPGSVRITRVECSEFGTSLTAPGHRFPTGAQVRLEGLPGLDSQTFLVEHPSGHKFSISHEISVSVKSIDPVGSIVQTERPHQLGRVHDLRLTAYDASAQAQVERFCMTGRALDESSLYLEAFSKATKTFGPAELLAEWTDGVLSTPFPTGMVVPQHAWKQYECCRGSAVVVCRPPLSEESCLREWRAALSAARELGGGTMFKTSMQAELDLHDCSRLHVQHSGWADCNGIYQRSGHLTFSLGALISITHVEELGMWCLFADVVALYPLSDHRAHMRLGNWDGPQLLYVRTGDPLGYWEPVIGPGPGPFVEVHKEVSVQQPPSTQSSCLLHPSVGSVVLDLLFNYAHASWSGGLWSGSIYGLSPLEALVFACGGPASPCYACKRDKVTVLPFFSTSKDPQLVDHAKELLRGMQEGDSSPEIDDSSPGIHADEESAESNDVLSGLSSEDDQPNDETDAEIDAEDGQPE